jgi:hypothetical protein
MGLSLPRPAAARERISMLAVVADDEIVEL